MLYGTVVGWVGFARQRPAYDGGCERSALTYESSDVLKIMRGHARFCLKERRRAQGPAAAEHFRRYCSLPALPEGRLSRSVLQDAEQRYPWRGEVPDVTLTLKHETRELVAMYVAGKLWAERMEQNLPEKIIFPHPDCAKGAPMPPHSRMFIWPGQELVGCRRNGASKDHVENRCLYTVTSIEGETVTVQLSPSMVPAGKARPQIVLSDFEAGQLLRFAYARNVAGCQGLTSSNKRVHLLEAHRPRFCKRKLYVAASRCTDPEYVSHPS